MRNLANQNKQICGLVIIIVKICTSLATGYDILGSKNSTKIEVDSWAKLMLHNHMLKLKNSLKIICEECIHFNGKITEMAYN